MFEFTATHQKTFVVSASGSNTNNCGTTLHCRTLSYALSERAKSNDIIELNCLRSSSQPFTIDKSFPLLKNITLVGTNGSPTIIGNNSFLHPFLFHSKSQETHGVGNYVEINVLNIKFIRTGIVRIAEPLKTLVVNMVNCTASKLASNNTSSFISSAAAKTFVTIKNSVLYDFFQGIRLDSPHVELNMESSTFSFDGIKGDGRPCSQLVVVDHVVSLTANVTNSKFKRVFLIDLSHIQEGKSLINITNSIFDDEIKTLCACSSGMVLRNAAVFFANTHFSNINSLENWVISVQSSYATFAQCLFRKISAMSSPLKVVNSNSTVSFEKCHFEGNVAFNFTGAVYLQESNALFMNCTFENNDGPAIYMFYSGSVFSNMVRHNNLYNVKIFQCLFKKNFADKGGAIHSWNTRLYIENTTFLNNSALSGGAIKTTELADISIVRCYFDGNSAKKIGGAIVHVGVWLSVAHSTFKHNRAASGGAFYSQVTPNRVKRRTIQTKGLLDISIVRCRFYGNSATKFGGAIMQDGGRLSVASGIFEQNHAAYGGALYSQVYTPFTVNGVTVQIKGYSDISIVRCLFKNHLAFNGGVIKSWNAKLNIRITQFFNNTADNGGVVDTAGYADINIARCRFSGNIAKMSGGAIRHGGRKLFIAQSKFYRNCAVRGGALYTRGAPRKSRIKFSNCYFVENESAYTGGAIHGQITSWSRIGEKHKLIFTISDMKLKISQCHFIGNRASTYGGAIHYHGDGLSVINTTFRSNTAVASHNRKGGGQSVRGGAIMYVGQNLFIKETVFENNVAVHSNAILSFGGAIESHAHISTTILHCSFKENKAKKGSAINSDSKLVLKDVYVQDINRNDASNVLLNHWGYVIDINTNTIDVTCSQGKSISAIFPKTLLHIYSERSGYQMRERGTSSTISCLSCPQRTYSLYGGRLGPNVTKQTHIRCYKCPFGGNCTNGFIQAKNNFWGYLSDDNSNEVRFTACPFGYCCLGYQCEQYNSCGEGREGILCGQCQKDLTENILSANCLQHKECRHPWFLLIVLIGGIIYALFFMYPKEIADLLKKLLIPKFPLKSVKDTFTNEYISFNIKSIFKGPRERKSSAQSLTGVGSCELDESFRKESSERLEFTLPKQEDKKDARVFAGLLKIVIFFYQVNVLFKVYSVDKSHGCMQAVQELTSTLFNLRTEGIFYQGFPWCPVDNLRPVLKLLLKKSFVLYLILIVLMIALIFSIGRKIIKCNNDISETFCLRLHCCLLRIILMSYATITVSCLSLLSCVKLGVIGKVLYIDGSIKCYTWWQFIIIAIVCFWIVAFPVVIYAASWLMHNNKLSTGGFLLSLFFPFVTVLYWIYIRISMSRRNKFGMEFRQCDLLKRRPEEILEVLEGPFRMQKSRDTESNYRLPWESILITRRLLLIFAKTFILDVVVRLYVMLFLTILFLIHHVYVGPFSSRLLNAIEALSLILLVSICSLNVMPAYIYMNPTFTFSYSDTFIHVSRQIETFLNLMFPFLIGVCAIILGVVRILQLIFCFCRYCVRLFRRCRKKTIYSIHLAY